MPTWRIEDGECRDSLALEVAAQCKLPPEIVARASQFYQACTLSMFLHLKHACLLYQQLVPSQEKESSKV